MLWGIKTRNSQVVNFDDNEYKLVIQDKQSAETSSQSIKSHKKIVTKKSIQQLVRQMQGYQAISKYVDVNKLRKGDNVQMKRYRECIYLGQMKEGKKQGQGIMLYTNDRVYEGQWHQNFKCGKGHQKFSNSSLYQGEYKKGKPHGYGKYQWQNGQVYEGEWIQGLKSGSGIWRGSKGDSYIGEWRCGKADGYGVHTWINGNRYQGQFKQCLKHGQGLDKFANGDSYKGQYCDGKPHGYGQYYWANASSYKGEFRDGLRNGKGTWRKSAQPNSDTYEGQFKDQKKQGYGVFIWSNGSKYIGNFANDLRQGHGEMYWNDGNVYKGQWKNGQQVQQMFNESCFNLELCCPFQRLGNPPSLQKQTKFHEVESPNPEESSDLHLYKWPEIVELKRFRARGMNNKIRNGKNQNSVSKITGGCIGSNNFVNEAFPINNGYIKSPNKIYKRPSKLSFNGGTKPTSNASCSKNKIKHSQSTCEKKVIPRSLHYSKVQNKSTNQIPIRNFQGVELVQDGSQFYSHSNPRSNIKIKPRVIKSSNGVRNVYKESSQEADSFWEEVQHSRDAILARDEDKSTKWFTRSKNKSQYF